MSMAMDELATISGGPILLDEYSLADAIRITGVTEPALKNWMANGTLQPGDWRVVPGARGPDRHGYMILRSAIARAAADRGRVCNWAAARSAQATPQVGALISQLRAKIESLEAENERLRKRIGHQWRYGAEIADLIEGDDAEHHPASSNGHSAPVARSREIAATVPAAHRGSTGSKGSGSTGLAGFGRVTTLPGDLTSCSAFADDHGFLKHQHVMWREAVHPGDDRHPRGVLADAVIRGEWKVRNSTTKVALDAEGCRAFVRRFSRNSFWKRCGRSGCACGDESLYPDPEHFARAGAHLRAAVPAVVPVIG